MKRIMVFGLICVVMLLVTACGGTEVTTTPAATTAPAEDKTIEITLDEFTSDNDIVSDITIGRGASLTVRLGSNPSTGYSWGEAEISDVDIITQVSREFVGPEDTEVVGAPGTDVWVFNAAGEGSAIIKFVYERPWEAGEQDAFTLTINVTVN